jgi:O-antigen/teichoic acid export membrane protein
LSEPSALKNTFYSTISTYVEYLFGMIVSILIARQLGPEQFGIYGYLLWLSALLGALINAGLSLGSIKFIAEARATESTHNLILPIYKLYQKKQIVNSLIFGGIAIILIYYFGEKITQNINPNIIYIVLAASIFKTLHMFCVSILKGFEDFRGLALVAAIISPINIILVCICYFTHQPLKTYFWVYFITSASYLFISYPFVLKKLKQVKKQQEPQATIPKQLNARILNHLRSAIGVTMFGFITFSQSELFFLNLYSTTEEMAFYNIAFALSAAALTLVPGVYSSILLPLMARENRSGGVGKAKTQLKISLRYMFQLVIALVFPVCFFAEEILVFLYGNQYIKAALPFRIFLLCALLTNSIGCFNAYLWSIDKGKLILKLFLFSSILTLILDFFLIKQFQLKGALIAFSISAFFITFLYALFTSKISKIRLEWKIYIRSLIAGGLALLIISPIGHYLPNIYGAIVGGLAFVLIYALMLLFTLSLRHSDISLFKKLNKFVFRRINKLLINLENRTKPKKSLN